MQCDNNYVYSFGKCTCNIYSSHQRDPGHDVIISLAVSAMIILCKFWYYVKNIILYCNPSVIQNSSLWKSWIFVMTVALILEVKMH